MADDTHTPPVGTERQVKTVRWCHWHQDVAVDPVLIDAAESISGPPKMRYACERCVTRHKLTPL